jgi:enoyl-CoA hydratase
MASEDQAIRIERDGPVTTVVISRPDRRNAVDGATAERLAEAFVAFERDPDAKVGVLWGEHGTFCAGADLKAAATGEGGNRVKPPVTGPTWDPLCDDGPMGPSRMLLSKPVIAAIAGHAVAGGLELALWCDMRVAEEEAVLGVFCRRWGVPLVDGGTVRLPRLIGQGHAMDLILTGRPVEAREALSMGLVNRVVPVGEARAAAEALAHEIARFPEICMRADRRSAYEQWDLPLDRALANEYARGWEAIRAGETVEGAKRFASGKGRGGRFDDI